MATVGYKPNNRLSSEEIEARVWAFVIVVIACDSYWFAMAIASSTR
jgi:hypothetical protein